MGKWTDFVKWGAVGAGAVMGADYLGLDEMLGIDGFMVDEGKIDLLSKSIDKFNGDSTIHGALRASISTVPLENAQSISLEGGQTIYIPHEAKLPALSDSLIANLGGKDNDLVQAYQYVQNDPPAVPLSEYLKEKGINLETAKSTLGEEGYKTLMENLAKANRSPFEYHLALSEAIPPAAAGLGAGTLGAIASKSDAPEQEEGAAQQTEAAQQGQFAARERMRRQQLALMQQYAAQHGGTPT